MSYQAVHKTENFMTLSGDICSTSCTTRSSELPGTALSDPAQLEDRFELLYYVFKVDPCIFFFSWLSAVSVGVVDSMGHV